ncbi:MAG TPA: hypothetical protein VIL60_06340 [Rhodanobacter sp.]
MGIIEKLFGYPQSKRLRLIRELARFRIQTDPAAPVMGIDSKMIDTLSDSQLMTLPEASIAVIVESYITLLHQGVRREAAIRAIDDHRAISFHGDRSENTQNIYDYVIDRIRIEHTSGPTPDEGFIDTATFTCLKAFGMELRPPSRPKYHVIKEFELSTFRLVLAKYTRRDGGYLYPWRLLAFDKRTEGFAFSYNLEVTPVSCCLGSYSANGTHFNFGDGDPEMTLEAFEGWAIPKAISNIYGDHVLTPAEMHAFGTKVVADYLGEVGMQILNINKNVLNDPQIYALKDGRTAALIVRVATYPNKGVLDESEEQVSDLIDDCCERDYDLYFASVGLANANARNDYELGVLLRKGSYHVAFSGVEQIV